jgi:hypothetical protein
MGIVSLCLLPVSTNCLVLDKVLGVVFCASTQSMQWLPIYVTVNRTVKRSVINTLLNYKYRRRKYFTCRVTCAVLEVDG